jgi:hypothetical protein
MRVLLILLCGILILGCNVPDGKNLEKTVEYFYSPGKTPLPADKKYDFLSTKTKDKISLADYELKIKDNGDKLESAKVIRKEEVNGKQYGVISLVFKNKENLTEIKTSTWLNENGKWKLHHMFHMFNEADRMMASKDYSNALIKYNEIIAEDPFSVGAYKNIARFNHNADGKVQSDSFKENIVEKLISINKDDSDVNFTVATCTKDHLIAKAFLKKLEGTENFEITAANIVEQIPEIEKRLQFIEELKLQSPHNIARKIKYLAQLKRYKECSESLKTKNFENEIIKILDIQDFDVACYLAYQLVSSALASGESIIAQNFFEYAAKRDPNNSYTKDSSNLLKSKNPQESARAAIAKWK